MRPKVLSQLSYTLRHSLKRWTRKQTRSSFNRSSLQSSENFLCRSLKTVPHNERQELSNHNRVAATSHHHMTPSERKHTKLFLDTRAHILLGRRLDLQNQRVQPVGQARPLDAPSASVNGQSFEPRTVFEREPRAVEAQHRIPHIFPYSFHIWIRRVAISAYDAVHGIRVDSVRQWVVGSDHMHARSLVELNACYETGEKVSILSQDDSCMWW